MACELHGTNSPDSNSPDWDPSIYMGYTTMSGSPEAAQLQYHHAPKREMVKKVSKEQEDKKLEEKEKETGKIYFP